MRKLNTRTHTLTIIYKISKPFIALDEFVVFVKYRKYSPLRRHNTLSSSDTKISFQTVSRFIANFFHLNFFLKRNYFFVAVFNIQPSHFLCLPLKPPMPPLLPLPLVELPANCSRLEIVVEDDAVTDFVVLP